jgi:hypothetical protein
VVVRSGTLSLNLEGASVGFSVTGVEAALIVSSSAAVNVQQVFIVRGSLYFGTGISDLTFQSLIVDGGKVAAYSPMSFNQELILLGSSLITGSSVITNTGITWLRSRDSRLSGSFQLLSQGTVNCSVNGGLILSGGSILQVSGGHYFDVHSGCVVSGSGTLKLDTNSYSIVRGNASFPIFVEGDGLLSVRSGTSFSLEGGGVVKQGLRDLKSTGYLVPR